MNDDDLYGNFPIADQFLGVVERGVLRTHGPSRCAGQVCPLHNPSAHPLAAAPLTWRGDKAIMERTCEHGIGHPDPDSLDYLRRAGLFELEDVDALAVHGCDGCCRA